MAASANDEALREAIDRAIAQAGVESQRGLIRRILTAGIGLGQDRTERINLKITAAAVEEMRMAFRLFAPYAGVPKATIFGSARTLPGDPLFASAEETARALADDGWMVVTGAGPGIMEAAATGAGPERSIGVSIRLPFEEEPSEPSLEARRVAMKYFFTRKLMLVKESKAFVCMPGGFGTLDETFELFTLQQTGKMEPTPIVLLDRPGGTYWQGFRRFVAEQLEGGGFVTPGDLDRVLITDSVDEAVAEIRAFWSNYHSMRWVPDRGGRGAPATGGAAASDIAGSAAPTAVAGSAAPGSPIDEDELVLRVRVAPTPEQLRALDERFAGLLQRGGFELTDPLPAENGEYPGLPRVRFVPRRRAIGELHRLIRALNELPRA
ncbi:MAG: TIGR00730 family Rossman fold protein [Leucobacter sp.]